MKDDDNEDGDEKEPPKNKDYDVGYRRPPKKNQFQKGRSGNPRGRPKGTKNFSTDVKEELNSKVPIKEGDKTKQLSKQRVMIKQQVAKALRGDFRAFMALMKFGLSQGEDILPLPNTPLSAEDKAILEAFVAKLNKKKSDKDDE